MIRPGAWQPGQSGNPRGRPPKGRALTEILQKAGGTTHADHDGKRRAGRRIMARAVWELAATGETELAGGRRLKVADLEEWLGIVKFLYQRIDGAPPKAIDVTTGGETLNARLSDEQRIRSATALVAALAARSDLECDRVPSAVGAGEPAAMAGPAE